METRSIAALATGRAGRTAAAGRDGNDEGAAYFDPVEIGDGIAALCGRSGCGGEYEKSG
jgi:hypothetical protein